MSKRRMRIRHEVWIAEERDLQFVRLKLDQVEFRSNLENHRQLNQQLIQYRTKITPFVAGRVQRTWQPLSEGEFFKATLILLQVHN